MPDDQGLIRHVSDTALLVSACRAMELRRPDGLVHDPFAERLAGSRGMAIARETPGLEMLCFGVGIRSRFMDRLVAEAVTAHSITTVLSVGCGLDTRPWRLELPRGLRWIEADFPAMLEYKAALMAEEEPNCSLERLPVDLKDAAERRSLWNAAGAGPGLMITEGLLTYLAGETVEALAAEAPALSGTRYWMLDLASAEMARLAGMDTRMEILNVRAPGHLDGYGILGVLRRNGWSSIRHLNYTTDALEAAPERIQAIVRAHPAIQEMRPPAADDPSGVQLFAREERGHRRR